MIQFVPWQMHATEYGYDARTATGERIGGCRCLLQGYHMQITQLDCTNDDFEVCEGLIRAALQYAGNRNAYLARVVADGPYTALFLQLGFVPEGELLQAEIPSVLRGNCGDCAEKAEK